MPLPEANTNFFISRICLFFKFIDGHCFVTIYDIKWHATTWILGKLVGQGITFH